MASVEEVVNDVFGSMEQSRRSAVLQILIAAGVDTADDIAAFDDPDHVRKCVGRPLPSYIFKPLRQRGFIRRFSPAGDPYAGRKYLRDKENRHCRTTCHVIETVFSGVDVGAAAAKQLAPLFGIVNKQFKYSWDYYEACKELIQKMSEILPIQYKQVDISGTESAADNDSILFRFRSGKGKVMWMLAAGGDETQDNATVGGLMSAMDELFSEETLRHYAFAAVTLMGYVWVFKFIPERFEPVACLYELLDEGGLEAIAKLMCAPPSLYGVE